MSFSGSLLGGSSLGGQDFYGSGLINPWSPSFLFARAEPGVWYDPSDLTTLFQDTAGTQPVTTAGQSVALMLDKSRGLTLGPELVDTANTTAVWVTYGNNTVEQDGDAVKVNFVDNAAGAYVFLTQAGGLSENLAAGKTYQMQVQLRISSGSANFAVYATSLGNYIDLTAITGSDYVTRSYIFSYSAGSPYIQFANLSAGESIWIRGISVRELPGYHATQATTASRPIYAVEPTTGRRNLLTYSEQFDNAAWTKNNVTLATNAVVAPDGTITAEKIIPNAGANVSLPIVFVLASQTVETRTLTAFMKSAEYSKGVLRVGGNNPSDVSPTAVYDLANGTVLYSQGTSVTAAISSVGSGWYRCSLTYKNGPSSAGTGQAFAPNIGAVSDTYSVTSTDVLTTTNGTSGIYIWGAQLETGSTATAYQRVVSKYDVTEAGIPARSYLSFDGIDDFMVTPTITPGIDKVQVFAGVRKLSDATSGTVIELSATWGSNNGTVNVFAPSTTIEYAFGSKGTTAASANVDSSSYEAPITNILTGIGDISGDSAVLRINGAQAASSTADQGTGNYLSYPLYIGRRGGTTLPFNGNIYGLLVRFGANLNNSQVIAAERWLNNKTGAY